MLILKRSDVEKCLTMEEAIKVMEEAFASFSSGKTQVPLRTGIHINDVGGDALFMPGCIEGTGIAIKLVSSFPKNLEIGKPTINSVVVLEDLDTGEQLALMDGTYLTALRTGAASGAATKHLARKDAKTVAVIGAGVQARTQLWAVCSVRDIREVRIYDPDHNRAKKFIDEMRTKFDQLRYLEAKISDQAVTGADIVITATPSDKPVFSANCLKKGVHINAIGSFTPTMQEISQEVLSMSSKIVMDSKEAVLFESGDFIIPIQKGLFSEDKIYGELGEITSGRLPGRETAEEITLFKTVGIAAQDVACAVKVYNNALKMKIGEKIDLNE